MDVKDYYIIYVSGRGSEHKDVTLDWLEKHNFPVDHLHMRKSGDYRKDYIIKKEIYDEMIKEVFDILFILDDRKQVVDMWRKEGLTVLHCAEGDF